MSQPALKFVHASDFHLDRPLGGVAEVPAHLRDLFLDAPYLAAEQVFNTAVTEGVDALLLTGDIVDFHNVGPRAVVFLTEQFQRLAKHDIQVYWSCGEADPADSWPSSCELPENVHVFPVGRVETIAHYRNDDHVATIQGISRGGDETPIDRGFHRDAHGLFTIGMSYLTAAKPGSEGDRVHYMALGGQHQRETVDEQPGIAHYSGTPQGRSPSESGTHGCTLISVDDGGNLKTRFVATDAIRWLEDTVEVVAGTDEDALYLMVEQRIAKLRIKHQGIPLLITWKIQGRGQLLNHIRTGGISDDITSLLREQFGEQQPAAWTVGMQCSSPLDVPREWYDEDTIMGDVLREFRKLQADESIPLHLAGFLPGESSGSTTKELTQVSAEQRDDLLWAASKMAVDMMDGEEELTVNEQ